MVSPRYSRTQIGIDKLAAVIESQEFSADILISGRNERNVPRKDPSRTRSEQHGRRSVSPSSNLIRSKLTNFAIRHLATLDTHLSDMLRPLTAPSNSTTHSQLPQLLSSLPMAPTKALKGLTPLPPNAPRTLRRGQAAANLKRAQGRDAANGILAGARNGREALSLKEKRAKEGEKRERGLGASLGKMKGGGLTLSREEIARGNGEAPRGSRGGRGGRGGSRGGRGASRGRGRK